MPDSNYNHQINFSGDRDDNHDEDFFRNIIENSDSLVTVVNERGQFVYVNRRMKSLLGYEPSACIGKGAFDFVHPDDKQDTMNHFRHWVEDDRESISFVNRLISNTGKVVEMLWTINILSSKDGKVRWLSSIARDVSNLKNIEQALQESHPKYFSLYNAINEGVAIHTVIYDEQGEMKDFIIDDVNKQYEINTGLSKQDVQNRLCSELFGELPFMEKYAEVDRTGTPVTFETWVQPLKRYFRISAFSLGKGKFGTAFSDITREKEDRKHLERALKELQQLKNKLEADNLYLREEINLDHNFDEIISASDTIHQLLSEVENVARTNASVLIQGETGTGKELFARAIHSVSKRGNKSMVKLNCAAIPETLMESELFGHEKGAFTGAVDRKAGRFEIADGSTLFLDEVGEIPLLLQSKLLRVLQDGEFERIGGQKTLKVDVRIISATNRDLEKEVEEGRFRRDLFYRLNVFPLYIPPLRERKEDISLLVRYFVEKFSRKTSKDVRIVSLSTLRTLENYDWPGNVRELENIIERAVILTKGDRLEIGNWFPEKISKEKSKKFRTLEAVEKDYITEVLKNCKWKVSGKNGAAGILGLNPTTLESRMKKLGINRLKNS